MIKIAIIGATGYTGLELIEILYKHPDTEIAYLAAKLDKPEIFIDDEFPTLRGRFHQKCYNFSETGIPKDIDLAFLAVPHTAALNLAPLFLKQKTKVIDLSADFRLKDPLLYEKWYKVPHSQTELLKKAVYGLPELYKDKIKKTDLIANPGCFPTGIILGVVPILNEISCLPVYINSTTGASGAGRKASLALLITECVNNIRPYKVNSHQHQPEIEQELSAFSGKEISISFVPNLAPIERGIISTIFIKLKKSISTAEIIKLYQQFYIKSPFVEILPQGFYPELKNVLHTNSCHIGISANHKELTIITAIDNLVKGAAGQAVQNMNLMFDFPEEMGLK